MPTRPQRECAVGLALSMLTLNVAMQLAVLKQQRGERPEDGTMTVSKTLAEILAENKAAKEDKFQEVWKSMKTGTCTMQSCVAVCQWPQQVLQRCWQGRTGHWMRMSLSFLMELFMPRHEGSKPSARRSRRSLQHFSWYVGADWAKSMQGLCVPTRLLFYYTPQAQMEAANAAPEDVPEVQTRFTPPATKPTQAKVAPGVFLWKWY